MKVAGLDLSITATGAAHEVPEGVCTHTIKTKGTADNRLTVIRNKVHEFIDGCDQVLIEGMGFASVKLAPSAMVQGALRAMLIDEVISYAVVPPNSLKKYATGNGTADKTAMAMAAFKRAGVEFPNDNECDAWWCYVMCKDWMGEPMFSLPAVQRESLKKIEKRWPL